MNTPIKVVKYLIFRSIYNNFVFAFVLKAKLITRIMKKNTFVLVAVCFASALLGAGVASYAVVRNTSTAATIEYVNRSGDPWDIPAGTILLGHCLQTVAPTWLTLAHHGFCVVEENHG